jgi:hypothetical protein
MRVLGFPNEANTSLAELREVYFEVELVELLEDAALSWIRPTPAPPTAPARMPRMIRKGTLSNSDFFFSAIV